VNKGKNLEREKRGKLKKGKQKPGLPKSEPVQMKGGDKLKRNETERKKKGGWGRWGGK